MRCKASVLQVTGPVNGRSHNPARLPNAATLTTWAVATVASMFAGTWKFDLEDGGQLRISYCGEDYGWEAAAPGKKLRMAATPFGAMAMCMKVPDWARAVSDQLLDELATAPRFACDCCHHRTLLSKGDYEICMVCSWEDDSGSDCGGGPNHMTLAQGQANFRSFGAMRKERLASVRRARPEELPDERR